MNIQARHVSMPLGIVLRKSPGVTRWAKWSWRAVAVLPGAADASFRELRRDGECVEYHAATLPLDLYSSDAEAYLQGLSAEIPSVYVVLHPGDDHPEVARVTASPFESQDYEDSGEEQVEKVLMPEGLVAWVRDYVEAHHEEEAFIKRRRDKSRTDRVELGRGDPRIKQVTDVYRAPGSARVRKQRLL